MPDCEKAAKLAGNLDEIAELRQDICNQVNQNRKDGSLQGAHLAQAQQHIDNGRLSVGQKILEGLTGDHAAELLKLQAWAKRLELEDALQKANQALGGDDIEEAINIVLRTSPLDRSNAKLAEVITIIKGKSKMIIRENLNAGRIDLAESLLLKSETFVFDSIELEDFQRTVEQCHITAKWLQQGRPREAITALEQMKTRLPEMPGGSLKRCKRFWR